MKGIQEIDDQSGDVKRPDSITKPGSTSPAQPQTIGNIVGENFDSIMKLATDIVSIKRTREEGDVAVKLLKAKNESLLAEAERYAKIKGADTNDVIQKMTLVREMLKDFYAQSNQQITGEDFRIIITEIVKQMGSVERGGK